jgi:hypothetical protein
MAPTLRCSSAQLELMLHRRLPCRITLRLIISGQLTYMRQMKLGEEPLYLVWWRLVVEDVCHHAVQEGLIIVVGD